MLGKLLSRKLALILLIVGIAVFCMAQARHDLMNQEVSYLAVQYPNEGVTGTTINKLVKLTGAPSTAIITATTDTSGIVGIAASGTGTSGTVAVAYKGKALCVFDSATTAGHYVVNDTSTAGDCMDGGATYPTSGQIIGVVTSTNGGAGTYEVDLGLGQPQAGGAGGGNSTTTGTWATNPGTCTNGDLRFPSDGFTIVRCASNTWVPWGVAFPFIQPAIGDFAWINQGGATSDVTKGGIYLEAPPSAGNSARVLKRTATVPYTVTAAFQSNGIIVGNVGLVWRQSSDGKLTSVSYGVATNVLTIGVGRWSSPTSLDSWVVANYYPPTQGLLWIQISDDNTNRIARYSADGQHWIAFFSEARATYLTADEVGFYANAVNAPWATGILIVSWTQ